MNNNKEICAIILARGGSKRIKDKNVIKINQKPLISYTINELNKSKKIQKIFVMTDSKKIEKVSNNLNISKLEVIGRSKKSSTDKAQSEVAISEFLKNYDYKTIYFVQLTNIFLTKKDIDKSLEIYFKNNYDSMLSVIKSDKFIWRENNKKILPTNYNLKKRPLTKKLKDTYLLENGSFYIFSAKGFRKHKIRLFDRIGHYEMGKETYFDIDDMDDLKIAVRLITN